MEIVWLISGVVLGGIIGWLVGKSRKTDGPDIDKIEQELIHAQEKQSLISKEYDELKEALNNERTEKGELSNQLAYLRSDHKNLQEKLSTQKEEIEQLNQKFNQEFKLLANEIFEEKGKRFAEQNKTNLAEVLSPLKERIGEFQKKVEDTNKQNAERNAGLVEQIKLLSDLNKQITKEAENLTKALKGDTKAQGNWGEVILERILEKSGLEKGREYDSQVSEVGEDGKRYQPDVVVHLPDNKNIVVDSKVSLIAYERMANAEEPNEQLSQLKMHINSIKAHVKGLSEKSYQNLYGVEGLDFVLLFIPIEPAFTLAVQHDPELFNEAYSKNIVIVSPTTLIATLRTISSIWKQEYQNKNAMEIARQGGALYDKFVAFTEDLKNVGKHIEQTDKAYKESMKKLYDGTGNLVRRAENIKKLGAKTTKQIDQRILDKSED